MPRLTVDTADGARTVEAPPGKRLVLALEDEAQIDQLHSCVANLRPHFEGSYPSGFGS